MSDLEIDNLKIGDFIVYTTPHKKVKYFGVVYDVNTDPSDPKKVENVAVQAFRKDGEDLCTYVDCAYVFKRDDLKTLRAVSKDDELKKKFEYIVQVVIDRTKSTLKYWEKIQATSALWRKQS